MSEESFPWDIGVHDAHCHPTDTMPSIASIPDMKAATLTVMATRGQDQSLVQQAAQSHPERILPCFGWHPWFSHQIRDDTNEPEHGKNDHDATQQKINHYASVLTPSSVDDPTFVDALPTPIPLSTLIADTRARLQLFPRALVGEVGLDRSFRLPSAWTLQELNTRDTQITPGSREGRRLSPYCVKLDHQRVVLKAQLRLAGEMARAVSLHSVKTHGVVLDVLKELWAGHERVVLSKRAREKLQDAEGVVFDDSEEEDQKDNNGKQHTTTTTPGGINHTSATSVHAASPSPPSLPFPPRICLHSYSGTIEPVRPFLNRSNPSDIYFSFSTVINFGGARVGKVGDVIKALPADRVLVESDLHTAGPEMDELLEQAARQICELRGWGLRQGMQQLAENWKRFVAG
ncbi:hypothetical protein NUU61_009249 [Penicillium alfredii]|uniref:Cut9 interacting protein Scn1 n=1 Tax=Penicillium alfredii TaxID=1506179 RepID=A0A9W9EMX0_9EURO|nr:uncharacterized protein NUU61_009249 [Penicillium alfredii]KAJ5084670.1 hypothetical protein NUU61_009249 [Penicillium alfredii]